MKIIRELPPDFRLYAGGHPPPVDDELELCFDEAVAWMFGEVHTAKPQCMCPVIAMYGMRLNDRFDDEERQLLVRLLPRCGGTRSTREVERKRSLVLVDASIREIVPLGLDAVGWTDLAAPLRAIDPIVDTASARAAYAVTISVREEARKRSADAAATAYDEAAADAAAATAAATTATEVATAAYAYAATAAATTTTATATATAYAYDAATAYAYDAAAKTPEERARIRSAARRPIVLASIAAFERAIGLAA